MSGESYNFLRSLRLFEGFCTKPLIFLLGRASSISSLAHRCKLRIAGERWEQMASSQTLSEVLRKISPVSGREGTVSLVEGLSIRQL